MKNNSGFSLVELIVVIAIMAILAGVAVPTYSKYVAKANDAALMTELDEIKTAAFAAAASNGDTVSGITVTDGTTDAIAVTTSGTALDTDDVLAYLDETTFSVDFSKTTYKGKTATWSPPGWTAE